MDVHDLVPIGAILTAAAILVVVLWRLMSPHIPPVESEPTVTVPAAPVATPELSQDEAEYLDSSHIISPPPRARKDPR